MQEIAETDGHNKKLLENTPPLKVKSWNYLKKENWTIPETCLTENTFYYAKKYCGNGKYKPKLYKGIYKTTFEKRYTNHKTSSTG